MANKKKMTRKEMRRRRRQRILIIKTAALCVLLVVLGVAVWFLAGSPRLGSQEKGGTTAENQGKDSEDPETGDASEEETVTKEDLIDQADALAMTYDYDGAINLLQSAEGAATDPDMISKVSEYTASKNACVRVDINQVTHIFYHSLVVDPQKAFFQDNKQTEGFCEWMTTVDEFNKITQQMYDNGYVLVGLHDLVKQTRFGKRRAFGYLGKARPSDHLRALSARRLPDDDHVGCDFHHLPAHPFPLIYDRARKKEMI